MKTYLSQFQYYSMGLMNVFIFNLAISNLHFENYKKKAYSIFPPPSSIRVWIVL